MEISATGSSTALQATSLDPVGRALRRPVEQLGQQAESTRVQLSEAGRLRSANAAVADAAKALQQTDKPKTADELRTAASRFVSAINNGVKVANEIAGSGRNAPVTRTESGDASRVRSAANIAGGDIRRAVADGGNRGAEELRGIGIDVGRDGSLKIDKQRFDAALASDAQGVAQTLDRVGKRVEVAASEQNSSRGSVGRTVEALTRRAESLEARRDDVQARGEQSQRFVREQVSRTPFVSSATAAYQLVFSL
jgi:hypothetical protein